MVRSYILAEQKREIEHRAHRRCEYCKSHKDYASHTFHVEHIIPIAAGGKTSMENLALACGGCNGFKATRVQALDPVSKSTIALFHPRQQNWPEHFIWSADFLKMLGITPTGRATVDALKLNRTEVMNLRRIMLLADLHPPNESVA